jgi:WD40 repeat protein
MMCSAGELLLWDVATGQRLHEFEGLDGAVTGVAYSPDGKTILVGSNIGTLTLMNADQNTAEFGSTLWRVESGGTTSFGVFSPDGRYILSGSNNPKVFLRSAATGKQLHTYEGHTGAINTVAFSPDGAQVAATSNDGLVILWNVADGSVLRLFQGHSAETRGLAFAANGSELVSTSDDRSYIVWNLGGTLQDVLAWTLQNRYVREFTCDERGRYGLNTEPYCSETGVYPTRTPLAAIP